VEIVLRPAEASDHLHPEGATRRDLETAGCVSWSLNCVARRVRHFGNAV